MLLLLVGFYPRLRYELCSVCINFYSSRNENEIWSMRTTQTKGCEQWGDLNKVKGHGPVLNPIDFSLFGTLA